MKLALTSNTKTKNELLTFPRMNPGKSVFRIGPSQPLQDYESCQPITSSLVVNWPQQSKKFEQALALQALAGSLPFEGREKQLLIAALGDQ